MTQRYLGGIITANPTEPSENFADSAASGMWTMQEALSFSKAGDWPDPASINPSKFVENIFSTYVYDGNGGTQSINNGIDLSGEGGLVWFKDRDGTPSHRLFDTENGVTKSLRTNGTNELLTQADTLTAFNNNGFSLGADSQSFGTNVNGRSIVSWTFRKQPKFFDVVTYTGNGSGADRQISHSLGVAPGMILIKRTSGGNSWYVFHRETTDTDSTNAKILLLNDTSSLVDIPGFATKAKQTDAYFTVNSAAGSNRTNDNGESYVAYLFAHNNGDGGFGATGDQDIIKCGSYTGNGSSSNQVDLGFEPQWVILKNATASGGYWLIYDTMRGIITGGDDAYLSANDAAVEGTPELIEINANGFKLTSDNASTNNNSQTYVYMAIRRGLMKAPTAGTDVLTILKEDSSNLNQSPKYLQPSTFPVDFIINKVYAGGTSSWWSATRMTNARLQLESTASESSVASTHEFDHMNGVAVAGLTGATTFMGYMFRRAHKFFDVVAYTGTGDTPTNVSHNLGVTPELIIVKNRSNAESWAVFNSTIGKTKQGFLNTNGTFGTEDTADQSGGVWGDHTSSIIQVGTNGRVGTSSQTYVAYLFATLAGVSKVGTYSGTGSDVNVDCGFTNGARFVLAKRTDSTGSWYVWDSARGIVAGNDPYLLTDSTADHVTNTDYIDPLSSGFTITNNAGSDLNHNGGTYVFLAIA